MFGVGELCGGEPRGAGRERGGCKGERVKAAWEPGVFRARVGKLGSAQEIEQGWEEERY